MMTNELSNEISNEMTNEKFRRRRQKMTKLVALKKFTNFILYLSESSRMTATWVEDGFIWFKVNSWVERVRNRTIKFIAWLILLLISHSFDEKMKKARSKEWKNVKNDETCEFHLIQGELLCRTTEKSTIKSIAWFLNKRFHWSNDCMTNFCCYFWIFT